MENLSTWVWPGTMLLDADYDNENNHELLRDYLEIESIIPAKTAAHQAICPLVNDVVKWL